MTEFAILFAVFFPFAAAIPLFAIGRRHEKSRDLLIILTTLLETAASVILLVRGGGVNVPQLCWLGLNFEAGGFPALMSVLTAALWLGVMLASPEYFENGWKRNRFYLFFLFTLGAVQGIFLASDLGTVLIFFEIMSFTSYVWVAHDETPGTVEASKVYLAVAVLGGLVMLMGLYLIYNVCGTLDFAGVRAAAAEASGADKATLFAAGLCALFCFGAKASMFPLHFWLPMSYPAAPAPGTALLSAIISKAGVFGVIAVTANLFFGNADWGVIVLVLGTVTMAGGALLAIISDNLKRTVACSSMSQIGFILVGVGMQALLGEENITAVWGSVLHMFNHSVIKFILFISAGVVFTNLGNLSLKNVRGFGKGKPWLLCVFLAAAVSVGGVPLFSGYISKTLLHESIVEYIALAGAYAPLCRVIEVLFLISGGLTAAYMANLFVTLFVDKPENGKTPEKGRYMSVATAIPLAVCAVLLVIGGVLPHFTMERIAAAAEDFMLADSSAMHTVHYFSPGNLKGAGISLGVGALVYFLVMRTSVLPKIRGTVNAFRTAVSKGYFLLLRGVVFVMTVITRFAAAFGDWVVVGFIKIIFFRAPRVIRPGQRDTYGSDKREHIIEKTFSLDLLLATIGVLAVIAYLIYQNRADIF